jgi:hypothetical protein
VIPPSVISGFVRRVQEKTPGAIPYVLAGIPVSERIDGPDGKPEMAVFFVPGHLTEAVNRLLIAAQGAEAIEIERVKMAVPPHRDD